MDYYETKALNSKSYQKKFKGRGKAGTTKYPKMPSSNYQSGKWGGGTYKTRLANKVVERDESRCVIVDRTVNCTGGSKRSILMGSMPRGGYKPVNPMNAEYRRKTPHQLKEK